MLVRSSAIVLHTQKYNDTSLVVVLFTATEGAVPFLVRIPKSRRATIPVKIFRPLQLLDIEWDGHGADRLRRLRTCTPAQTWASIPYNPLKTTVALFLSEFLYYTLRQEKSGGPLFDYIRSSLLWLDLCQSSFSNFHLVFLLRLTRFLGFYPNVEGYANGCFFDLLNGRFTPTVPNHPYYIKEDEAAALPRLLRMNYRTMQLFRFSRAQRGRVLDVIQGYYRLHVPGFPGLKSLDVLREVFAD